jgi:hypothetical protein
VISAKTETQAVIPAKAGTQTVIAAKKGIPLLSEASGTPACAGVTRQDGDHSRRQVVPPGPSSKTMPSDLSSLRMRSAVAKSRFFLAAARSAIQ